MRYWLRTLGTMQPNNAEQPLLQVQQQPAAPPPAPPAPQLPGQQQQAQPDMEQQQQPAAPPPAPPAQPQQLAPSQPAQQQEVYPRPPPGYQNKIVVNLKQYNGQTDPMLWWTSFMSYIMLQRMAEWEALLVLPFYLIGIAEQWFELLDVNTKSSLDKIKTAFLNRFNKQKQEDIGLTNLKQQENESVDNYIHRALSYNKTNSVSEEFLVKLTYRGLKPGIQHIVVPQNPTSMADLLGKAITAEMTVNMVQPQTTNVESTIFKAVASIEDKIMDKITQRLDSIASLSSTHQNANPYSVYHNSSNSFHQPPQPAFNQQPMMPLGRQNSPHRPTGPCIGCGKSCKSRSMCPAYKKSCHKCGKPGHFSYVCKGSKTNQNVSQGRRQ